MTSRKEILDIIDIIEEDYRRDLSLHLYSTHLLHQINPLFPRRNWSSWPQPMNTVPDPGSTKKYCDMVIIEHIKTDLVQKAGSAKAGSISEASNILESVANHDSHSDVEEDEREADIKGGETELIDEKKDCLTQYGASDSDSEDISSKYMRVRSVATTEALTDSRKDLLIELFALLENRIKKRLRNSKMKKRHLSVNLDSGVLLEITKQIANCIDMILNQLIYGLRQSGRKRETKKPNSKLLNWQDVVLASLSLNDQDCQILSSSELKTLYEDLEYMFQTRGFPYEYDYESSILPDDSSDISSHSNCNETSEAKTFDVIKHLDHLEKSHEGMFNYSRFKERVLKNWTIEANFRALKKKLFFDKLKLQDLEDSYSWGKNNMSFYAEKKSKKQKVRSIGTSDYELALKHGGINLSIEDFTIDISTLKK